MACGQTWTCEGVTAEATVVNLGRRGVIGTGICFLDHMVDQLTSHAQVGVSLRVRLDGGGLLAPLRDYAVGPYSDRRHDEAITMACGRALGLALRSAVGEALTRQLELIDARERELGTSNLSSMLRDLKTRHDEFLADVQARVQKDVDLHAIFNSLVCE